MTTQLIQGSPEWLAARLGKVTASRIADVMAQPRTKGAVSATRQKYLYQLLAERLSGQPQETFTNAAMAWGTENEPLARAVYEAETGNLVSEVGLIDHPSINNAGASPDGLVGSEGLIEIKCPNTSTHIDTLLNGTIDTAYQYQMQWQMACTGRKWCDFVSFDPRLDRVNELVIIRVNRDDAAIEKITAGVELILSDLDRLADILATSRGLSF
jgi:putative phage-type endonuclease